MKEKILESLRKNYSSYGLSKEALDAVASILEKSITTEEEIETSIVIAEPLLKQYQKEADAARGAKAKAEKELAEWKANHPQDEPKVDEPKVEEPKVDPEVAKLVEQMAEMQRRLAESDRKVLVGDITKKVDDAMKAKGCVNDAVRNIILGKLIVADDATIGDADKLAEGSINEYNTMYKSLYGESPVPNMGGDYNPQEYKAGMFSDAIKKMENAGILPKENDK